MPQQKNFSDKLSQSLWDAAGDYKVEFQPDTEAGLRRLQKRMRAEQPVAKRVSLRRGWLRAAAAVLILVIALVGIYTYTAAPLAESVTVTAAAEQIQVELPDGTRVWLRDGAEITYADAFAGDTRAVSLTGEAFFDVVENPQKPFVIQAGESTVTVLGTSFSVNSEAKKTTVLVKTGKVAFQAGDNPEPVYLTKDMQAVYTDGASQPTVTEKYKGNALAWQTGLLQFRGVPLSRILSETAAACKVKIVLENNTLAACKYTDRIDVKDKSPAKALTAILELTELEMIEKDGIYYLRGGKSSC